MSGSYHRLGFSRVRVVLVALTTVISCTAAAGPYIAEAATGSKIVIAEFRDVSPILVGNDVKSSGVKVGQVADISLVNGVAKLALELQPSAFPLHSDAQATVKPVSLLGERFVDLNSGSASAPLLPDGAAIPVSQTHLQTDLDQVLNIFDEPTGQALAAMIAVLGEGFKGNGADVDAALKALAPSMNKTDQFVKVLQDQNTVLNQLVENLEPVARSLAVDDGKTIDNLIGTATSLLNTTAVNQAALQDTLKELPGTFTAARATLGNLADASDPTRDTLHSLRPVTDNLVDISHELINFTDAADPALDKLVPVLERGRVLLEAIQPVAVNLHRLGPDFTRTTTGLSPIVREASKNINAVLDFVRYWALTTNGKDGLTHYFRATMVVGPTTITGNVPNGGTGGLFGRDPAPDSGQPERDPDVHSLLSPTSSSDGGVTGLNPKQESGALGFMLGGGK
ncbi:MAG: MCE family protein [Pseudonocardia sp.]|nr:MCE family protein [Pseudonocardia sp.]